MPLATACVSLAIGCSSGPPGDAREVPDAGVAPGAEAAAATSDASRDDASRDSIVGAIERRLASGDAGAPAASGSGPASGSRRIDTLRAFYRDRDHRPVWLDSDAPALRRALRDARKDGLPVDPHRLPSVDDGRAAASGDGAGDGTGAAATAAELARREIRLSSTFLRLASDLARGTIDPSDQGLTWRIERGDRPGRAPLEAVARGEDPADVLDRYRPDTPQYERLREALGRYRAVARAGRWDSVPAPRRSPPVLEPGDSSRIVPALRSRLAAEPVTGALDASDARAPVYDSALSERVRAFQRRHGLVVDGVVGAETLAELNRPVEDRLVELVLNLDRLRWLPSELGERYLVVNVAGFEMEIVEADTTALTTEVVVGKPAWKTPIFSDTLSHVIVNPYWNVPRSIAEEEILPAARDDPSYIDENRFQAVERFGSDVEPIPGDSIDWRSVDPDGFPHLLRQAPGPDNSLGRIKFLFPNRFNVYLHDTPADQLFEESSRAFSHGCIRVEQPLRVGRYLFRTGAEAGPDELEGLVESGERTRVDLATGVPVYVVYLTAWSEPGGPVHFHDDIYERDEKVQHRAREIVAALGRGSRRTDDGAARRASNRPPDSEHRTEHQTEQ